MSHRRTGDSAGMQVLSHRGAVTDVDEHERPRSGFVHGNPDLGQSPRHVSAVHGNRVGFDPRLLDGKRFAARRDGLDLQTAQWPVGSAVTESSQKIGRADRVSTPQSGERPRLGQAPKDQYIRRLDTGDALRFAGDRVAEGLVHHQDPGPADAMPTHRPWGEARTSGWSDCPERTRSADSGTCAVRSSKGGSRIT